MEGCEEYKLGANGDSALAGVMVPVDECDGDGDGVWETAREGEANESGDPHTPIDCWLVLRDALLCDPWRDGGDMKVE